MMIFYISICISGDYFFVLIIDISVGIIPFDFSFIVKNVSIGIIAYNFSFCIHNITITVCGHICRSARNKTTNKSCYNYWQKYISQCYGLKM